MAQEITLTDNDISTLQTKLDKERSSLDPNETKILEGLLARAKEERDQVNTSGPGWLFRWTYRF